MAGRQITVTEAGARVSGDFEGFSEDGALLTCPKSGTIERHYWRREF